MTGVDLTDRRRGGRDGKEFLADRALRFRAGRVGGVARQAPQSSPPSISRAISEAIHWRAKRARPQAYHDNEAIRFGR